MRGGEEIMIMKKITATLTIGALLTYAFTTNAFADTTVHVSGNGSSSDNNVAVSNNNSTTISQSNNANISNNVSTSSNTGGNQASDNTGGDVSIDTGDADSNVKISNIANLNSATVGCCASGGDADIHVSGNGTRSDNNVDLEQNSSTAVFQDNDADIDNNVDVSSHSGWNRASDNTGGDVEINTGDVDSEVSISSVANANLLNMGNGGSGNGDVEVHIMGNGSHSDSSIGLSLNKSVVVVQDNDADIDNNVDVHGSTGGNRANDNTSGDVMIDTGDVDTTVEIDNMANFNSANVDCSCLMGDLMAKIAGNGSGSDSEITADFWNNQSIFQDNRADFENDLDLHSKTGHNYASGNTGDWWFGGWSDPRITSGDSSSEVKVNNTGNANVLGGNAHSDFPDFDFDFESDSNRWKSWGWSWVHEWHEA